MKGLQISRLSSLLRRPSAPSTFLPAAQRCLHDTAPRCRPSDVIQYTSARPPKVPSPIPLVPDVETFLSLIGRDLKRYTSKIPTWEALFTLNSEQLRELGVEPARSRRYLISWLEKFRLGLFGIAGDFKHVEGKEAYLKIYWNPETGKKYVINVPKDVNPADVPLEEHVRPRGFKLAAGRYISGPGATPLKQFAGSKIAVVEGMWEDNRGVKKDGGERRRAETKFKKRIAERKAAKEAALRAAM